MTGSVSACISVCLRWSRLFPFYHERFGATSQFSKTWSRRDDDLRIWDSCSGLGRVHLGLLKMGSPELYLIRKPPHSGRTPPTLTYLWESLRDFKCNLWLEWDSKFWAEAKFIARTLAMVIIMKLQSSLVRPEQSSSTMGK